MKTFLSPYPPGPKAPNLELRVRSAIAFSLQAMTADSTSTEYSILDLSLCAILRLARRTTIATTIGVIVFAEQFLLTPHSSGEQSV